MTIHLTETPELVTLAPFHYAYIEKVGPFQETAPAAWGQAHSILKNSKHGNSITGARALFKISPEMVYRAGFTLASAPPEIPEGCGYVRFEGGRYARYTLTGSYHQLGPAWGRTIELFGHSGLRMREAFYIENYANDPAVTPEEKLISELMIPVLD